MLVSNVRPVGRVVGTTLYVSPTRVLGLGAVGVMTAGVPTVSVVDG